MKGGRARLPAGMNRKATWPAYAIAWSVGLFCAVVAVLWTIDHLIQGNPVDATGWVVIGATGLRALTIVIVLASVRDWGRRVPRQLMAVALWGCAVAQLAYPATETMVKAAVLVGVLDLPAKGIGNMSAIGWFNFAAAWLVFGAPGLLFILAARSHAARHGSSGTWPVIGVLGGLAALFAIGWVIG